ncbi:ABC transporter ATP-binding protein [Nocardioides bruguierae]|uniref:ABC transporter ATP-binding protein n=1 Tax=Nocardioides bruguierae TaxID=2945102 RepID=A0A9X2IDD0_9ACTN|nr:ABC transporter ATP-binding protein [Nocardioides bruguierae]MCM0618908.1 ABC transporter ATP-binding protein [Nocardioides bruguierae]
MPHPAGADAGPSHRPAASSPVSSPVSSPATSAGLGPALEVRDLSMTYGSTRAVDGLSLEVPRGSITAVLGPNGAGKTTTLETCEGYRRPQAGSVRVLGLDPVADRRALLPRIGVMLQSGGAWSGVRAEEMLRHVARLHARPLDQAMLSERLGLAECGRTPYRRLSGGQKQRLALAVAVVGRPELVFVDEPTAGMDPQARRATWELLEELRGDGVTVVLTTHYMDEAERLADVVHIIDRGRLVATGTPSELTRGGRVSTLRLVLERPVPEGAPQRLAAELDATLQVLDATSLVLTGPADSTTLGRVAAWCEQHDVVPVQLSLGTRSLEDAFLELTGRDSAEPGGEPLPAGTDGSVEVAR